ncbi:hypothetical protein [Nocardioides sambongensis]|uniref:hypothetical protein n=1 Tax=Nocardioides sambongensis TaxID=2589074 RepID=UPI001127869C|nr:hypothetical protein [Nocardioides sambongensis]
MQHGARISWAGLALAGAVALTGCGDEGSSEADRAADPSSATSPTSDAPANAPACSDIWYDGGELPRVYRGCVDDEGAYLERDFIGCSSGQRLVLFDDRFYAFEGGPVFDVGSPLEDSDDYRSVTRRCTA